jgi:hypothetical protein
MCGPVEAADTYNQRAILGLGLSSLRVGVVQEGERTSKGVGKFIRQADASGPAHS